MDDKIRCFGSGDPLYAAYHDEEWGRPVPDTPDERAMYERLVLEGFQAGLSWLTILRKRDAFREAFHGFNPAAVAEFDDEDVERLMSNTGIVRNRAKITAAIGNARALLAMHDEGFRLTDLIQGHAPAPRPRPPLSFADLPAKTDGSMAASAALKQHGFRFVGPTIIYALMEAVGMVDDHIQGCWLAGTTPRT
ncbi:DNA-3-methyladenine glycosylase [Tessaracoccus lapidicaptus]|uniref:DNA-3-methyladenine glycosylase n=1 Tax=Tessaracoccus lapidicaptus TaxID=1427523 RepID=A0A1C0AQ17_9ACTN|nr:MULTISPECIES: DNA-3-methyladenine glycosylase I [Tessaracoccus]AQX15337.1 DNA-3-methyladenine glycosylase [Tessaracoccus sp. T2.5-30]OCL36340.1 DNA-3-methyladenine glycosylase [Tessaracoccus lapidicaptus]VEP39620.1 DNA-3-methyladenine glycosylase 1 [Tessaracoccus lapidicaptus]